jgi:hypothetical protein
MRIGTLKSYILHEETKGDVDFCVLKIDSSEEVLLQASKNNKVTIRKKIANLETAKNMLKTSAVGQDFPRAFDKDSPSNHPFSNSGGGGLLKHVEDKADKYNNRKNKKKKKKTVEKNKSRNLEEWHTPSGNDENPNSLVNVEFGRDYSEEEDGLDNALRDKSNGMRPNKPKSEFSPDIQEKPEEYKTNYDKSYGTDNQQNYEDRFRQRREKVYNLKKQKQNEEEQFVVYYEEGGKKKKSRPMSLERANEMKMKNNKSKIKRK